MNQKLAFSSKNNKLVLSTTKLSCIVDSAFHGEIFQRPVLLDHITVVRRNLKEFEAWCNQLVRWGARTLEAPGRWPTESCPKLEVPPGFEMMMATYEIMNGSLVLAAPLADDDHLSRHLALHGKNVLHHAAVVTDGMEESVHSWTGLGFVPGKIVDDGNLVQMFLRHPSGQLLELIHRRDEGKTTFSCTNIAQLRLSEVELEK